MTEPKNDDQEKKEKERIQKKRKLLRRQLKEKRKNLRFNAVVKIAEEFGFRFDRQSGSHQIYKYEGIKENLNLQNDSGKAKPYQVDQLAKLIDEYKLIEQDNNDAD